MGNGKRNLDRQARALRVARKFFKRKMPPEGTLVAVDMKSGECFCETDEADADLQALGKHPDADIHLIRIGHKAAFQILNPYWIPVRAKMGSRM